MEWKVLSWGRSHGGLRRCWPTLRTVHCASCKIQRSRRRVSQVQREVVCCMNCGAWYVPRVLLGKNKRVVLKITIHWTILYDLYPLLETTDTLHFFFVFVLSLGCTKGLCRTYREGSCRLRCEVPSKNAWCTACNRCWCPGVRATGDWCCDGF